MKIWIYCLSNPSFKENLHKVGCTGYDIEYRSNQLSSTTGVPTGFKVEYGVYVDSDQNIEKLVHKALNKQRYASNREFFQLDAPSIVKTIKLICKESTAKIIYEEGEYFKLVRHENLTKLNTICQRIYYAYKQIQYAFANVDTNSAKLSLYYQAEDLEDSVNFYRYVGNFLFNLFEEVRLKYPILFSDPDAVREEFDNEIFSEVVGHILTGLDPLENDLNLFLDGEEGWESLKCEYRIETIHINDIHKPRLPAHLIEHKYAEIDLPIESDLEDYYYLFGRSTKEKLMLKLVSNA